MEFCSKYGYNYGFEGSDSEEYSDEDEKTKQKVTKKTRKADTNIIAVKFDQLVAANERFAGEPKCCKQCGAMMSFLSEKNTLKENEKLIWTCEFCSELNDMTYFIDDMNEIPKKDDVTFMLELPKPKPSGEAKKEKKSDEEVSGDDSYLAFCIDVSGSMDTIIPVNDDNARNASFTRLNGVKVACMETLKKMKDDEPHRRVSLTTFSDQVKYYGDCTNVQNNKPLLSVGGSSFGHQYVQQVQQVRQRPGVIQRMRNLVSSPSYINTGGSDDDQQNNLVSTGQDLSNKERILTLANNLNEDVKGIAQSHPAIEQRIKNLRTEGSTALGPAMVFSIGFAAKKPGSSIILCTDGAANVGLGAIETNPGENTEKFYDDIADYAKERGVTVNVISMEGTDCKLALLGRVADRSNGTMSIVNPLNLGEEFKSILGNRTVATNVTAKMIVHHKYLYIRDEKLESEEGRAIDIGDKNAKEALEVQKKSIETRSIGNANVDTEITFGYGIRKLKDELKKNLKRMPFQLQITYTIQDGTKALRVYTKMLEFTTDRAEAERNIIEDGILLSHNAQFMSKQLLQDYCCSSKHRNITTRTLMARNNMHAPMEYQRFSDKLEKTSKYKKSKDMQDQEAQDTYYYAKYSRETILKRSHLCNEDEDKKDDEEDEDDDSSNDEAKSNDEEKK